MGDVTNFSQLDIVDHDGAAAGLKLGGVLVTATPAEMNKADGVTGALVEAHEVTYTENGAGTYTGDVAVPAGATIIDIRVENTVLWAAASSAQMEVGIVGDDDDGFYTAVDLKATDLLALESIGFGFAGGVQGAYSAGTLTHWEGLYSAAARVVRGTVVSVGAGTAGRTRMLVIFVKPTAAAAVKS